MNIKKILTLILSLSLVFSIATNVLAQNKTIPISDVNIQNVKVTKQDNNIFNISFSIYNGVGVQNGVKYSVRLMSSSEGKMPIAVDQKVYNEVLTLNEKSTLERNIVYTAPSSFSGTYSIFLSSSNDKGLLLGSASAGEYTLTSSSQGLEIMPETCTLSNSSLKGQGLTSGIVIKEGETINLNCTVINNSKDSMTVSPAFETHYQSLYGETIGQTGGSIEAITLSAGEKKTISVTLPKVDKPQTYETVFFLKGNNQESNSVVARYTILGASATIMNVSTDKDFYKKGETANLSLVWVGSDDATSAETIVSDKDGNICGTTNTQDLAVSKQEISVGIDKLCYNPIIGVSIKDKDGKVLDQKTFNLETNSISKLSATLGNIKGAVVVLVLILLVGLGIFMKRKGMHGAGSSTVLPAIIVALAVSFIPFSKTFAYCEMNGPANNQVNMCTSITTAGPYNQGDTLTVFGELQSFSSLPQTLKMSAITIGNTNSINLYPTPMYSDPIVLGPNGYLPGLQQNFTVNTPSSGTFNVSFTTQQDLTGGTPPSSVVFTGTFRWGGVQYWGPAQHPALTVHVDLHGAQYPTITSTEIHIPDTVFYIPANEIYGRRDGPTGPYCYPSPGSGCEIEGVGGFTYGIVSYVTGGSNVNNLIPDNGSYHVCRYAEDPAPDGNYFAVPFSTPCSWGHPGSTQYR